MDDAPPKVLKLQSIGQVAVFGGGFADIFKGTYDGQTVAVKRLRFMLNHSDPKKVAEKIDQEIAVWHRLSHPFILPLLGVTFRDEPGFHFKFMVSPWMQNGNLVQFLLRHTPPATAMMNRLISETIQGLCYLHSLSIAHGDLKGDNVLVDDEGHIRLTDFGLAKLVDEGNSITSSTVHGTDQFMAPELLDPQSCQLTKVRRRTTSDIYAFACLCVQVYTQKLPFPRARGSITLRILNGERPKLPYRMGSELRALVQECWSRMPRDRPTAQVVALRLEDILRVSSQTYDDHHHDGTPASEDDEVDSEPEEPPQVLSLEEARDYWENILLIQYLLLDPDTVKPLILPIISHGAFPHAARLLLQLYNTRMSELRASPIMFLEPRLRDQYERLDRQFAQDEEVPSENEAMAALTIIACFLLDGGQGDWSKWLERACSYTRKLLPHPVQDSFFRCKDLQRLIIKTTIWYDVLASITALRQPILLGIIQALLTPTILDPAQVLQLSMAPLMGCENSVLLALAETSALAAARQRLDDELLKQRCTEIQQSHLFPPLRIGNDTKTLSVDMFRAAARAYVAAVASGHDASDWGVVDAIKAFTNLVEHIPPDRDPTRREREDIICSTIFPLFLCASLTKPGRSRTLILETLPYGGVGNSESVKLVLEKVWNAAKPRYRSVPWQRLLKEANLLLV